MKRLAIGTATLLMTLACAGGPQAGAPPCTDEAFAAAVSGAAPFELDAMGHRACIDQHALVAVSYQCEQCEPHEQYFLRADGGAWEVLTSGTGMSPADCDGYRDEIEPAACTSLWDAFMADEKRRKGKKKRKKHKK